MDMHTTICLSTIKLPVQLSNKRMCLFRYAPDSFVLEHVFAKDQTPPRCHTFENRDHSLVETTTLPTSMQTRSTVPCSDPQRGWLVFVDCMNICILSGNMEGGRKLFFSPDETMEHFSGFAFLERDPQVSDGWMFAFMRTCRDEEDHPVVALTGIHLDPLVQTCDESEDWPCYTPLLIGMFPFGEYEGYPGVFESYPQYKCSRTHIVVANCVSGRCDLFERPSFKKLDSIVLNYTADHHDADRFFRLIHVCDCILVIFFSHVMVVAPHHRSFHHVTGVISVNASFADDVQHYTCFGAECGQMVDMRLDNPKIKRQRLV